MNEEYYKVNDKYKYFDFLLTYFDILMNYLPVTKRISKSKITAKTKVSPTKCRTKEVITEITSVVSTVRTTRYRNKCIAKV